LDDDIGICKIIPPSGWLEDRRGFEMSEMDITIEHPIKQVVSGRAGVFSVDLLEVKAMNIHDFADYDKNNSSNCGDTAQEKERKFWRSLGFVNLIYKLLIFIRIYSCVMMICVNTYKL
jgi:hypothetical protein